jgi:hypothetical protein
MAGAILSTGKKNYTTPEWIVDEVHTFFKQVKACKGHFPVDVGVPGITLDPCSNPQSHVAAGRNVMLEPVGAVLTPDAMWRTYEQGNGLTMPWGDEYVYVNPPFGYNKATKIGIKDWIYKALQERKTGAEIVMCIPDCPETKPWKNGLLLAAQGRCQLARRVKFGGMKTGIPKPISLVYLGEHPQVFKDQFKRLGRVENPSAVYADQAHISL